MRGFIRIVRNFFFIAKSIRKWLAINYNEGIVPSPPVLRLSRNGSHSNNSIFRRSTPKITTSAVSEPIPEFAGACLYKQSPIKHCYSGTNFFILIVFKIFLELPRKYSLAKALTNGPIPNAVYPEREQTDQIASYSSSLSFHAIINQFYQSFTGYIEDPEEKSTAASLEAKDKENNNLSINDNNCSKKVTL